MTETIHGRIKRLREARKWSKAQLAREVSEVLGGEELTYQAVQQWEREGGTAPTRKRLAAVAKVLGVTPSELSHGPAEPPKPDLSSTDDTSESLKEFGRYWHMLDVELQQHLLGIAKRAAESVRQEGQDVMQRIQENAPQRRVTDKA